jgi:hypothetical protein
MYKIPDCLQISSAQELRAIEALGRTGSRSAGDSGHVSACGEQDFAVNGDRI